jgi:hypothetical protein
LFLPTLYALLDDAGAAMRGVLRKARERAPLRRARPVIEAG